MNWNWMHFTFMNVAWMSTGLMVGTLDAHPISSIAAWSMFVSAFTVHMAFMKRAVKEWNERFPRV